MRGIDLANLSATFESKGGESMTISIAGLPAAVYAKLALVGAVYLLKRSADPKGRWERICAGNFGRPMPSKIPPIIHAIAHVTKQPVEECWAAWRGMSAEEKQALRSDKEVRKAMIDLED